MSDTRIGTKYPEIFAALAAPFPPGVVKTLNKGGRSFDFVDARVVMSRLDDVLGPEGWWIDHREGTRGLITSLSICLPGGEVITKVDGGGFAGMTERGGEVDEENDWKTAFSDGLKRCAVLFGVARYLYRCPMPSYAADAHDYGPAPAPDRSYSPPPQRQSGGYDRQSSPPQRNHFQNDSSGNGGRGNFSGQPPRSGRALFAWCKDQEAQGHEGLIQWLNKWAKLQDFPARMVDFDADQTRAAHEAAAGKIGGGGGRDDAHEEALAN